ncbi:MAG: SDR family oxidoreductase [Acidobacteria bacterium]|nr:SDR family oxidoreductase [Acidobacteriota bacterium]
MNDRPPVVVVTGASAGLGRAIVREFSRQKAHIGLLARGRAGLQGAAREVEDAGGKAFAAPADVSDPQQVEAAAEAIENAFGPIDIWINNAMVTVMSPVSRMKPEEYRRVTEVTYLGSVYGTLAALKRMLPRNQGVIVQVGSALAYRSIPLQSAYCGAKHALEGFLSSLRTELLHDGSNVRITSVHMPALNTTQFGWMKNRLPNDPQPVPPIYQPEVGARAVVYAAQHPRREMFVGISTVGAIVGNRIAPGLLDCYLARTGYESQQTDTPADPASPNNLWLPVPGDHGAHGSFDDRSRNWSLQLWANTHRTSLAAAGAGIIGAAVAAFISSRKSRSRWPLLRWKSR